MKKDQSKKKIRKLKDQDKTDIAVRRIKDIEKESKDKIKCSAEKVKTFAVKQAQVIEDPIEREEKGKERIKFARMKKTQTRFFSLLVFVFFLIIVSIYYLYIMEVISRLYKTQAKIPELTLAIIERVAKEGRYMIPIADKAGMKKVFKNPALVARECYDSMGYELNNSKEACAITVKYYKVRVRKTTSDHTEEYSMLSKINFLFEYNSELDASKKKDKSLYVTKILTEVFNQ